MKRQRPLSHHGDEWLRTMSFSPVMIVRVQSWLSKMWMDSSCQLVTLLFKPFISGDLLCRLPPRGEEAPGPWPGEQVQRLVPEIRMETNATQVISVALAMTQWEASWPCSDWAFSPFQEVLFFNFILFYFISPFFSISSML